jgi:hypothetical protein|tara:strand:- start:1195 stop:1539 length:345 start_codon:yes stop_codon:yes gene_type:complete
VAEYSFMLKKQFRLLPMLWLGLAAAVFAADPTQPPPWLQRAPVSAAAADVPLRVQQILIRKGDNRAVINNRLVQAGDVVDGAQVMAIYADKVVVKIRQKRHELSLLVNTRRISE